MSDDARQALEPAYRATRYEATGLARPIIIGQRNSSLDAILAQHHRATWAFITAWNPRSEPTSDAENESANAALRSRVALLSDAAGRRPIVFDGCGVGVDSQWPPEDSFLIVGVETHHAAMLCKTFGQMAWVAGAENGVAELLWTDDFADS